MQDHYDAIDLLSFGAGAAAYGLAETISQDVRLARTLDSICVIDFERVGPNNFITCPNFAGHEGEWKACVLTRHWVRWLRRAGVEMPPHKAIGIPSRVQAVDYASLLAQRRLRTKNRLVIGSITLDDWEAKIHAERSLRRAAIDCDSTDIVVLQISLDRNLAQVRLHGTGYKNVCQVCGLDTIPEREPCVLFRRAESARHAGDSDAENAELVRGDLRAESHAAGRHACHVIDALLDGNLDSWIDTKTRIYLQEGTITKTTSRRRKQPDCFGPHSPPDDAFDLSDLMAEVMDT